MDGEERAAADSLSADLVGGVPRLLAEPRRAGFYHAVALLERSSVGAVRVGDLGPVGHEAIRFRHDPSLSFPSSDVRMITARARALGSTGDGGPTGPLFEITTTFLGLTGVVSPLPTYMAEEVLHEDADKPVQRQFLDIFHHRIMSLLYRAHTRYAYSADYLSTGRDAWSRRVLALSGVDTYDDRALPTQLTLSQLLRLAPLLASRGRTAEGLAAALADVLADTLNGAGVAIEQFVGRWVTIEERQLMRLGVANTTLGQDATIGRRVFDRGGKFRVVLGPLHRRAFQRLQPGGEALNLLREVATLYVRDPLEFDVELVLGAGETPALVLSSSPDAASRLGLDAWLSARVDLETRVVVAVPQALGSGPAAALPSPPGGGAGARAR